MGNFGAVAIEPVKVIPEVGLETRELQELALVACLHSILKEFIVMLVIHCIVISSWLAFKSLKFGMGVKYFAVRAGAFWFCSAVPIRTWCIDPQVSHTCFSHRRSLFCW